jgi:hypothetical protein
MRGSRGLTPEDLAQKPELEMSSIELLKFLRPYFIPRGFCNRLRVLITWLCLGASKVATILAPPFIGLAADAVVSKQGPFVPVYYICMYCGEC